MFGIGGCEEVWSSIFWAQRRGKRDHQMKGCVAEQKVSDWQMNAWTLKYRLIPTRTAGEEAFKKTVDRQNDKPTNEPVD